MTLNFGATTIYHYQCRKHKQMTTSEVQNAKRWGRLATSARHGMWHLKLKRVAAALDKAAR